MRETRTMNGCSCWVEMPSVICKLLSPFSLLLHLFPCVVTYFGRYGNAPWTDVGKISPHFASSLGNPFLIYNLRHFSVSSVYRICKSFSSGYIFAGGSSFKDCVHFGERKHFIGKTWVKRWIFSPSQYQEVDLNKYVLSWKPNHLKKGVAWWGRSSTLLVELAVMGPGAIVPSCPLCLSAESHYPDLLLTV